MSKCYLIIDCGTTNLRVTLLDENRQKLDAVKAEGGVRHTSIDGHNGRLRTMLHESIQTVLNRNGYQAEDVEKCVASGMITSALGLLEIPHVAAPAGVAELRAAMQEKVFEDIAPFPIAFIPGVRNFSGPVDLENFSGMDMMRGEEVEAIGLYKLLAPKGAAMFVLPGTHNKFVSVDERGRILGCMTSISGELLDAVTHHTIIAEAVGHSFVNADEYDSEYAKAGARECAVSGLGRAAFAGRILSTLGGKDKAKLQSYLLGATLALDVQAMQSFVGDQENVEAYIAGKAPLQQCMCDVIEALAAGEAVQVPVELSGMMGLAGVMEIAF
ncbi:MAG: 2-dehydro-3-deoxygalactonokinase [Clostridia bacterium]|nr:2-dehydro-3-deoxygalactonokinase [Clostridia bacterium]